MLYHRVDAAAEFDRDSATYRRRVGAEDVCNDRRWTLHYCPHQVQTAIGMLVIANPLGAASPMPLPLEELARTARLTHRSHTFMSMKEMSHDCNTFQI